MPLSCGRVWRWPLTRTADVPPGAGVLLICPLLLCPRATRLHALLPRRRISTQTLKAFSASARSQGRLPPLLGQGWPQRHLRQRALLQAAAVSADAQDERALRLATTNDEHTAEERWLLATARQDHAEAPAQLADERLRPGPRRLCKSAANPAAAGTWF